MTKRSPSVPQLTLPPAGKKPPSPHKIFSRIFDEFEPEIEHYFCYSCRIINSIRHDGEYFVAQIEWIGFNNLCVLFVVFADGYLFSLLQ